MEIKQLLSLLENLYKRKLNIIKKKNNDYSDSKDVFSNFKICAIISSVKVEQIFLMLIACKIARLTELITKNKEICNESIEDTLIDLSNYTDLFYIYCNEQKEKTNE